MNEESVGEARKLSAQGMSCTAIADRLGVHLSTVAKAVKGKTWEHVDEALPSESLHRRGSRHSASKVNDDIVREIRTKKGRGMTYKALSEEYGLGVYTIFAIVTRKTWKHVE